MPEGRGAGSMDERIREVFLRYADEELEQIVISKSKDASLQKVKIRPVQIKDELRFQTEEFRGAQVFHKNMTVEELNAGLEEWFHERLFQAQISHRRAEVTVLLGKKGTVTIKEKKRTVPKAEEKEVHWQPLMHNREKKSLLPEGSGIPFLKDLGVFSAEGKVIKGKYDKFRQINRFLEFIEDVMPELSKTSGRLNILDFGCGKSYLTFAIYYYLTECKKRQVNITGLDLKADVIKNCNRLAEAYGYENLHFLMGDVADYKAESDIDMMVTLHACDTATDYALQRAVQWGAKVILSVPCCQHEVNEQLSSKTMEPLFRYGLIKERMAALITDALRAELLTACGYKVQILEFIDMEHTPKNLLIRAVKKAHPDREECRLARIRSEELAKQLGIRPKLIELLDEEGL